MDYITNFIWKIKRESSVIQLSSVLRRELIETLWNVNTDVVKDN